jgi:Gram-negative bacterial TonB protein C-terminal
VEATLLARCTVEPGGSLSGCTILKSHPFFEASVKAHLASAKVRGFTAQGKPVRVACNYPFRYKLTQ